MDRQATNFERTRRQLIDRRRRKRVARLKRRLDGPSSGLTVGWRATFLGY